ncbi:uncharacterized protein LOC128771033 [Synchiropus splendidus]|uniref:uncharacterized protein LOC128771033 n=1 Tax=Synchiropus splendidus TaxID=270530 RepID=UPI00237EE065|nr:uncharacterized protein LOC128771033 [Synchiropus splendidus]
MKATSRMQGKRNQDVGELCFVKRSDAQQPSLRYVPLKTLQAVLTERDLLSDEVQKLRDQLARERARQDCQELEEPGSCLDPESQVKEAVTKQRRELEDLQWTCHHEAMSASQIAAQVRQEIKCRKKKLLQKDYELLKVAYITSQERFEAELQAELNKCGLLQRELGSRSGDLEGQVSTSLESPDQVEDPLLGQEDASSDLYQGRDQQLLGSLQAEKESIQQVLMEEVLLMKALSREKNQLKELIQSRVCAICEGGE